MSDPAIFGHDLFGEAIKPKPRGPIAERFIFPPFTILDAKQGPWQDRKRAWIECGIQSEVGRGATLLMASKEMTTPGLNFYRDKNKALLGGSAFNNTWQEKHPECRAGQGVPASGSSIFDPVICECAYSWWSPPSGQIIDPFAGGSVRGIVAGMLGRKYYGIDLRAEQIEANRKQAQDIAPDVMPEWVCADSLHAIKDAPDADFVFSCPPYGDLEVYSDNPQDLSAMPWPAFLEAYRAIIAGAVARLKPNRFACFVVGDFRDERGLYRNFTGETVLAFEDAGARLYNEAILATSVGSASMRVSKQFSAGRKLCKTHQNVYVFVKGDWRKAADACKEAAHV